MATKKKAVKKKRRQSAEAQQNVENLTWWKSVAQALNHARPLGGLSSEFSVLGFTYRDKATFARTYEVWDFPMGKMVTRHDPPLEIPGYLGVILLNMHRYSRAVAEVLSALDKENIGH